MFFFITLWVFLGVLFCSFFMFCIAGLLVKLAQSWVYERVRFCNWRDLLEESVLGFQFSLARRRNIYGSRVIFTDKRVVDVKISQGCCFFSFLFLICGFKLEFFILVLCIVYIKN
jgi:hypothetical protein